MVPEEDHGFGKLFLLPIGFKEQKESILSRVGIARIHKQPLKGKTQLGTMLNYFHSKLFVIPNKRKVSCVVTFLLSHLNTVPQTSETRGTPDFFLN